MAAQAKEKAQTSFYLTDLDFDSYLAAVQANHPWLYDMIDLSRLTYSYVDSFVAGLEAASWEFEDLKDGGRGSAYNYAQKAIENRKVGMSSLVDWFTDGLDDDRTQSLKILDVLAGDGTIARFIDDCYPKKLAIISADLSKFMVDSCFLQNLPSIRQSATQSLFKNDMLDGGFIAYGSHHLDAVSRKQAVSELHRTLKSGGRIILHDFEEGGAFAKWFTDVVHPYSRTGHPHEHFSRAEMQSLLADSGFTNIRVFDMDDRFTLNGETAEKAHQNALLHLYHMYDLVNIGSSNSERLAKIEAMATDILGPIETKAKNGHYTTTIHRTALVATGVK